MDTKRLARVLDLTMSLARALATSRPVGREAILTKQSWGPQVIVRWDDADGIPLCCVLWWPEDASQDAICVYDSCPADMRAGIAGFAETVGLPWADMRLDQDENGPPMQ
jgi:hypothetical protein